MRFYPLPMGLSVSAAGAAPQVVGAFPPSVYKTIGLIFQIQTAFDEGPDGPVKIKRPNFNIDILASKECLYIQCIPSWEFHWWS